MEEENIGSENQKTSKTMEESNKYSEKRRDQSKLRQERMHVQANERTDRHIYQLRLLRDSKSPKLQGNDHDIN